MHTSHVYIASEGVCLSISFNMALIGQEMDASVRTVPRELSMEA